MSDYSGKDGAEEPENRHGQKTDLVLAKEVLITIKDRATESSESIAVIAIGIAGIVVGAVVMLLSATSNFDGAVTRCGSVLMPSDASAAGRGGCGEVLSGYVARAACVFLGGIGFLVVLLTKGLFSRLFVLMGAAAIAATMLGVISGVAHVVDGLFIVYAAAMIWFATRYWTSPEQTKRAAAGRQAVAHEGDAVAPSAGADRSSPSTNGKNAASNGKIPDPSSFLGKPKPKRK